MDGGRCYLDSFSVCLRATTKRRSSTLLEEKCTPDKILATTME